MPLKGSREWRRKQEWLAAQEKEKEAQEVVVEEVENINEGFEEALVGKVSLERYLQQMQKQVVSVILDRKDGEWIYVVRGMRPPISWWGEYKIYFVKGGSHNLRADTPHISQLSNKPF